VPAVVAPVADAGQDVDLAVAVPIDRIPKVVAPDPVSAGQVHPDELREAIAPDVAVVSAADDDVDGAVTVEVGRDQVLLAGPQPLGAVEEWLGIGAQITEQVDAVVRVVGTAHDEIDVSV